MVLFECKLQSRHAWWDRWSSRCPGNWYSSTCFLGLARRRWSLPQRNDPRSLVRNLLEGMTLQLKCTQIQLHFSSSRSGTCPRSKSPRSIPTTSTSIKRLFNSPKNKLSTRKSQLCSTPSSNFLFDSSPIPWQVENSIYWPNFCCAPDSKTEYI